MEKELTEGRCRFCDDGYNIPSNHDIKIRLDIENDKLNIYKYKNLDYCKAEKLYSFDIKFCPFCGKEIKQIKQ